MYKAIDVIYSFSKTIVLLSKDDVFKINVLTIKGIKRISKNAAFPIRIIGYIDIGNPKKKLCSNENDYLYLGNLTYKIKQKNKSKARYYINVGNNKLIGIYNISIISRLTGLFFLRR